jgi:peptidoglycan-associated lipoprotein
MTKTLKLFLNVGLLVALSLSFTSCGSRKKKAQENMTDEYPQDQKPEDYSLLLNGDSDSGKAGSLATVYFAYDSSRLSPQAKEVLDANSEFLKNNKDVEVQIEGHADERGGIQYNLALGQRRAKSVKQYLQIMGISASRLSTVSYGKERPLEFGHNESAWSRNRRANFVITAK